MGSSLQPAGDRRSTAAEPLDGTGRTARVDMQARILIVEDEVMIAWMIESLLEEMGFDTIEIAANDDDAFAAVARARPALIVSDINLGCGLDGIAVAERINADGIVPVLFVSGYADDMARLRIETQFAAASLLRKPIDHSLLRGAVMAALGGPARH